MPPPDVSFRLFVTASNPARQFKVSFVILPRPENPSTGRIHVLQSAPGTPLYREHGVVRRNLLDTLDLDASGYEDLMRLVRHPDIWRTVDAMGERSDGIRYDIRIIEKDMSHAFAVMGHVEGPAAELARLALSQFEGHFDSVSIAQQDSEISLLRSNHTGGADTNFYSIRKTGTQIIGMSQGDAWAMNWESYCALWQTLENHNVWALVDNLEYRLKYPVMYHLSVVRENQYQAVEVYAPFHLQDLRYYNIINAIESHARD